MKVLYKIQAEIAIRNANNWSNKGYFLLFHLLPDLVAGAFPGGFQDLSSITIEKVGTKKRKTSLSSTSFKFHQNSSRQKSNDLSSEFGIVPLPDGRAKCLLCAKEFSNMYNGRTHVKELHSQKSQNPELHHCHVCGATFTVARSRLNHLMRNRVLYF